MAEDAVLARAIRNEIRYTFNQPISELEQAIGDRHAEMAEQQLARARSARGLASPYFDPPELTRFDIEMARVSELAAPLLRGADAARAEARRRHDAERLQLLGTLRQSARSSIARGRFREAWAIWQQIEVLDPAIQRRRTQMQALFAPSLLLAGSGTIWLAKSARRRQCRDS